MSDKICQYEKYGICKLKKECPNYHPTLVCDDEKCTIKQCKKRHPVTCRYASVGNCQFGHNCKFDHRVMDDLKSHKNKIIEMERDFKLNIEDLQKKYIEVTSQYDDLKKEHLQISAVCGHQENVIKLLEAQVKEKFVAIKTEMQNQLVTVKTEVLNCLKSEVHKHDIEENCTRTHDSKRKRNLKKSKSEENISVVVNEDVIDDVPSSKKNKILPNEDDFEEFQRKRMERNLKAVRENENIEFVICEISKIKEFVSKERMIPKKVNETKQKVKKLLDETKQRIGTNKNEKIVLEIFKRMFENVNKTNLDFKNITKDIIDEFIKNCESEKEKGRMIELEILENEKKYFE